MGRKSKLTRELIEQAAKLIEAGNYQRHVAQALGIDHSTWYKWLSEGERTKNGLKHEFFDAVKKAEARAIARNVALIQRAAQDGNWQAAAWWLERKFPEQWGRNRLDIHTEGDTTIRIVEVGKGSE